MNTVELIGYIDTCIKTLPGIETRKYQIEVTNPETNPEVVRIDCIDYNTAQQVWKYCRQIHSFQVQIFVNKRFFAERVS